MEPQQRMRPVDPRLLRYARTTRAFLAGSVLLGGVGAVLVVAQASLIAEIVVRAFQSHDRDLTAPLLGLAAVAAGRAAVAWLTELTAHRSVARVKSTLRRRLLDHATALGPDYLAGRRTGELTALATRGIDALDDYFARYLPQLALAVVVPAVVLARILGADWRSAAVIAATLPLIPLFMVLIGLATQTRMDRQWDGLARLSHHFLDVVAGLPTLKVFGRAKAQARTIARITDEYRRATLRTLRIAFISSFALELLATLSVALVAVSVGFRLVDGTLDLETGLLVLVLAPEVHLPIRQVGALYHSSVEGSPPQAGSSRCCRPRCRPRAAARSRRSPARRSRSAASPWTSRAAVPPPSTGSRSPSNPASPPRSPARAAPESPPWSPSCWVSPGPPPEPSGSAATTSPNSTRPSGAGRSPGCRSIRSCSPAPSPRTSGSPGRTPPTGR